MQTFHSNDGDYVREINIIRTMPESNVPAFCKNLAKEAYSDLKLPKYVCDSEWYSVEEWNDGFVLTATNKADYDAWIAQGGEGYIEKKSMTSGFGNNAYCFPGSKFYDTEQCDNYVKKVPVNKICWIDQGGKSGSYASYSSYDASSLKDIDFKEANKALNEVKNSAEGKLAYQEAEQNVKQEASNYQNYLNSVKNSAEYQNYGSYVEQLKQTNEYKTYDDYVEKLKQSDEYKNYNK